MSSSSEGTDARRAARKRALFIVITDYPGGAERVAFSIAAELASRPGWEVEVKIVCAKLPDSFSQRSLPANVRVTYGPFRNWHLSFPLLPFRIGLRRYDLTFTTQIYTNALVSLLRRLRLMHAKRMIVRESMSLFDRFKGFKARRFPLLYKAYGGEDLILAQTGYMAEHVRPSLPVKSRSKLRTLPNPVDYERIQTAAAELLEPELAQRLLGRASILFCGRLVDFKRPAVALEAFRIATADQAAQLVFLGAGPLEQELRQLVNEAGMSGRVLFLGNRSNPYPVMQACQYGIVTSANEGFPNVAVEMMACGLRRIVMTPCAGDLEQLTGVTVTRTFETAEIATALRSAIESGQDCGTTYRKVAAARSVSAYLDALLSLS